MIKTITGPKTSSHTADPAVGGGVSHAGFWAGAAAALFAILIIALATVVHAAPGDPPTPPALSEP